MVTQLAAAGLFPDFPAAVAHSIIASQATMVDHPEPRRDTIARLTGRRLASAGEL